MKTRIGGKARLLARLALIAALPLGIWACEDAGDGPGGPTGPSTKYNPDIDYAGATLTATVSRSNPAQGETFTIIATFKDANGLPVDGVPLVVSAENGGAAGYFSYDTNPTLTESQGKASIGVTVDSACPNGSYRFVIAVLRGPQARGYVGIEVGGTSSGPAVTDLALVPLSGSVSAGSSVNFRASAAATASCTVMFQYETSGSLTVPISDAPPGTTNPWTFTLPDLAGSGTLTAGTLTVTVYAYCSETPSDFVSATQNVTVI